MKVLVTGGLGFIGSHIVRDQLSKGHEVIVVTRSLKKQQNLGDVWDKVDVVQALDAVNFDDVSVVYHCASTVHNYHILDNPSVDIETNCIGTVTLLELCKKHCPKARIVYVSSFFVHGKGKANGVVHEQDRPSPLGLYGATRLAGEHFCQIYNRVFDMNCVVARLCNVYGPERFFDDTPKGAFNRIVQRIARGEMVGLYKGNDQIVRDYVHVDDVVSAICILGTKKRGGGVYYVGTGKGRTLLSMVNLAKEYAGRGDYEWVDVPDFHRRVGIGSFVCDPSSLKRLGWLPRVEMSDGIKRLVGFYYDE